MLRLARLVILRLNFGYAVSAVEQVCQHMRIADRFFCSLICQQLRPLTRKRDAAASQIAFQVCFHRKIFYIRNLWKIRVKVYVRGGATFPFHRNRQNSNGLEPV